jgi:hypothetical protein
MTIANRDLDRSDGFTFVEMIFAVVIMMAVTGAVFSLMNPAHGVFKTQPEFSEMQQRLRVVVDALYRDLMMAGAGVEIGSAIGPLANYFPPVLPFRRGAQAPDPPGIFRTDRVSILYVPPMSPQSTTSSVMTDPVADIPLNPQTGCPVGNPLCRFKIGSTALVFDATGAHDTFRITGIVSVPASLQHSNQPLSFGYGPGAAVTQVTTVTYWIKSDPSTATSRLMRYDGEQSDLPVADHVIGLAFEYFGDTHPPVLHTLLTDPTGPWTSYGPRPPLLGVDNRQDSWPAGENCVFSVEPASGRWVPRAGLHAIDTAGETLVKLDAGSLSDGPWCPDALASGRVDADLLRIRRIRVTVKVRGPRQPPATQQVSFDVSPRNLNVGR